MLSDRIREYEEQFKELKAGALQSFDNVKRRLREVLHRSKSEPEFTWGEFESVEMPVPVMKPDRIEYMWTIPPTRGRLIWSFAALIMLVLNVISIIVVGRAVPLTLGYLVPMTILLFHYLYLLRFRQREVK